METVLMTAACLAVIVTYVVWCRRRDGRADRDHQAVVTAMSPGPRIRELTTVRPNPMRTRKLASGSRPNPMRTRKLASGSRPVLLAPSVSDFAHVPTDYGTYTPAQVDAEILGRADTINHHHVPACAESPSHDVGHHASHHDACSTTDTSHGGFDGGGHHGH